MNKENLSLLGQENVPYPTTYSPQILETSIPNVPTLSNLMPLNSPVFVLSLGNQTLQPFIFPTFRKTFLSKASL